MKILNKYFLYNRGFTLLELMVALAIGALLSTGAAAAIYQLWNVNNIDSARVKAVKEVENAVHWLNRDAQMAQKVEVNGTDYWLKLTWVTWEENQKIEVVYSLASDTLIRKYYEYENETADLISSMTIARHLITSGDQTSCSFITNEEDVDESSGIYLNALILEITAEGSSGSKSAVENRKIIIYPRSIL